ncbi:hypothetical protein T492DRAFT_1113883 [Pavlovales sp. CCMP2436]|nr:hypothetical protein T492DRAFT_1113883 [Pavlovales sp. CCMP2436]
MAQLGHVPFLVAFTLAPFLLAATAGTDSLFGLASFLVALALAPFLLATKTTSFKSGGTESLLAAASNIKTNIIKITKTACMATSCGSAVAVLARFLFALLVAAAASLSIPATIKTKNIAKMLAVITAAVITAASIHAGPDSLVANVALFLFALLVAVATSLRLLQIASNPYPVQKTAKMSTDTIATIAAAMVVTSLLAGDGARSAVVAGVAFFLLLALLVAASHGLLDASKPKNKPKSSRPTISPGYQPRRLA